MQWYGSICDGSAREEVFAHMPISGFTVSRYEQVSEGGARREGRSEEVSIRSTQRWTGDARFNVTGRGGALPIIDHPP